MTDLSEASDARARGRPRASPREGARAGQAPRARAGRAAARRRLLRRGGAFGQLGRRGSRRGRGRDGCRDDRRPPGGADGERPDREGRLVGPEDGREDPPHPGARAEPADPDGVSRRLGRGADHRAGADVPRPPRRGQDLPQPGEAVRAGPAGMRAVRPERRRRRLHPRVLRHRDHARGQRLDVSRLAADGGDGDRGEGQPRGDGRREDAHGRVRLRASAREERSRTGSHLPSGIWGICRPTGRPPHRRRNRPSPRRKHRSPT